MSDYVNYPLLVENSRQIEMALLRLSAGHEQVRGAPELGHRVELVVDGAVLLAEALA